MFFVWVKYWAGTPSFAGPFATQDEAMARAAKELKQWGAGYEPLPRNQPNPEHAHCPEVRFTPDTVDGLCELANANDPGADEDYYNANDWNCVACWEITGLAGAYIRVLQADPLPDR